MINSKEEYRAKYEEREGVTLCKEKIAYNRGLRGIKKLKHNNMCGKSGQLDSFGKVKNVSDTKGFLAIIESEAIEVTDIDIAKNSVKVC